MEGLEGLWSGREEWNGRVSGVGGTDRGEKKFGLGGTVGMGEMGGVGRKGGVIGKSRLGGRGGWRETGGGQGTCGVGG